MEGRRLGKLVLGRRIGGGGMGDVFLATREGAGGFQREVVVKLIRAGRASPAAIELFRREGLSLAALSHRNVVQVIELDRDQDDLYLAMEYLRGVDLRELTAGGRALPWDAAVFIAGEAARGLAAAHDIGLVHGDVSPANVMACSDGAVKVLDFGVARAVGDELPEGVVVIGKPSYLAPELVVGAAPDARTDVYALGATLYRLLVGEAPLRGETRAETLELAQRGVIAPPSERIAGLPDGLDAIVLGALARDRALRTRSAARLAEALEACLQGRFGPAQLARLVEEHQRPGTDVEGTATVPIAAVVSGEPHTLSATTTPQPDGTRPTRRARQAALALALVAVAAAGYLLWPTAAGPTVPQTRGSTPAPVAVVVDAPPAPEPVPTPEPEPEPARAQPAPAPEPPAPRHRRATAKAKTKPKAKAPEPVKPPAPAPGSGLAPGTLADPFRRAP